MYYISVVIEIEGLSTLEQKCSGNFKKIKVCHIKTSAKFNETTGNKNNPSTL